MAEILFKVGDNRGYRDGDIVRVAPRGVLIPPAAIQDWIQNATIPPQWSGMPNWKQRAVKRVLVRTKWLLTHTVQQITAEFIYANWQSLPQDEQEKLLGDAQKRQNVAADDRDLWLSEGFDTNWGPAVLRTCGAVRMDDLSLEDVQELVDRDRTEAHRPTVIGDRRWRIAFRSYLAPGLVTDLETEGLRVEAQRAGSVPLAALYDDPRS